MKSDDRKIKYPEYPVLIVDDEEDVLKSYSISLKYEGINNIIPVADSTKVIPIITKQIISLIILDLQMPKISGQELLKKIKSEFPEIIIIVITRHAPFKLQIQAGVFLINCSPVFLPVELSFG